MTNRNLGVYILFKADTAQAKAGAAEVRDAVTDVAAATRTSAEAEGRASAAIDQATAARKRQTDAVRAQVEAERQARHAAIQAVSSSAAAALPTASFDLTNMRQGLAGQSQGLIGELRQTGAAVQEAGAALQSLQPRTASVVSGFLSAAGAGAAWRAELNMIREKLNPAVAAHRELREAISDVETAEAMGALTAREASIAIDQLSRSMTELQARSQAVGISLTDIGAPAALATTQMQQMIERQTGFAAASASSTAATLRQGQALDDLRARYNPLFAASRAYELELRDIADAERQGAITALEAAAARERAAQAMAPIGVGAVGGPAAGSGMARAAAANLSFQINDIAMMTAMGQSPFMLMIQQGPQVAQIFSQLKASGLSLGATLVSAFRMVLTPWGLLAMGVIGGGAALVQWMMSGTEKAKTLEEAMGDLSSRLADYGKAVDAAGMSTTDLRSKFGGAATEAKALLKELQALQEARTLRASGDAFSAAGRELGLGLGGAASGFGADLKVLAKMFGIDVKDSLQREAAAGVRNAMVEVHRAIFVTDPAERLERMNAAMAVLVERTRTAVDLDGKRSKEEEDLLQLFIEQNLALTEQMALKGKLAVDIANRSGVGEELRRIEALRNEVAVLRSGASAPGLDDDQKASIAEALAAKERVVSALVSKQAIANDLDRIEIALQHERNPLIRADLEARRVRLQMQAQEVSDGAIAIEAERVRNRVIRETTESARARAITMQDEARIRATLISGIAAGTMTSAEANRVLQEELALRPLIAAAAQAEGLEKAALLTAITELRLGYSAMADAQRGQATAEAARGQIDQIDRLRLELSLVGATTDARSRALAIYDAEVRARQLGLDAGSREAEQMKARAAGIADLTMELERQRDAWEKVHRAAEGMIDGPIDALLKGDIKGALASFAEEFLGLYAELAWKNPLKNRMLGTNYATLEDVGGLGGLVGRMFGGAQEGPLSLTGASAMSAAAMSVTTPMVHISTSGLSGIPLAAGLGPAANAPWAPAGPSVAVSQLGSVAVDGALRPDALTGLNGPFAAQLAAMVTEAQAVFGPAAVKIGSAFRTVERQAEIFAQAVQKYGSEAAARKWAAEPGKSNHNFGLAADLKFASPAVQNWFHAQAPRFGMGFPMSWEPWHIEPANAQATKAAQSLPVAQLERLATTAEMATGQLGTFGTRAETTGQGLASLGGTFAQALQMFGASKGPGGMIAATLLGGLFKGIGLPGFMVGGPTGGSDPTRVAGLVHEEEFVFDAAATRRIGVGNLEAIRRGSMRGYQTGGYVIGGRPAVPAGQRAAMAAAAPGAEQRHVFEMNVSGTGNAEIAAAVHAAISQAFDQYDRNVFAGRVRMIINDDWAA